jgi:hypothetical protein
MHYRFDAARERLQRLRWVGCGSDFAEALDDGD